MIVAFAVATLLGLVVVAANRLADPWRWRWHSLGAAYFYTGGPKPLGYIALGELTVLVFMGPVMVGGAYYVMTERVTWRTSWPRCRSVSSSRPFFMPTTSATSTSTVAPAR